MNGRKTSKEDDESTSAAISRYAPWVMGIVALGSAGALLWRALTPTPTPAPLPPDTPKKPDGTFIEPPAAQGPIFPAHGRILVVGGSMALGLGRELNTVMQGIEASTGIPASPQIVTVWDGLGVTAAATFAEGLDRMPDTARNLDGLGAPDVVVVLVGEYDALVEPQGDMLAAITRMSKALSGVARDHLPNVIWIVPWDGVHADELKLPIAAAAARGAPGHVLPFPPKKSEIAMNGYTPTDAGYRALATQVASVLLGWWMRQQQRVAAGGTP